jgi:tRNA pseudouridine55 synthase
MEGIIVIDKPPGITSHDVVQAVRKRLSFKKVGHSGTLDPMATGVLVILVGNSTRLFSQFSNFDKEYEARLTLGMETDTGDSEGKIKKEFSFEKIDEKRIGEVFGKFTGEQEQVPPMFSALKFQGKKLYQLARKGISLQLKPRRINIYNLKLNSFNPPNIDFVISCSKGTYIRKLAEDIARALGTGGHLSQLRRIKNGPFTIKEAVSLEGVNESCIRHWPG